MPSDAPSRLSGSSPPRPRASHWLRAPDCARKETSAACSCRARLSREPPSRLLAMDFGVGYFPTHDGIGPGPLARMLEERGQESLFFAEHTHKIGRAHV